MLRHDFDAELHHWIIVTHPSSPVAWTTLVGVVWHDTKKRFADGRTIGTSVVLSPADQIQAGAVIQTMNTRYLLVGPAARRN